MNFVVTQAVLERPSQLHGLFHPGSHFPELSFPAHAPWLSSALSQLWDLEQEGEHLRGVGDFKISANTAIRVRKLLSKIGSFRDLPTPTVNVFSGGGVTLTWQAGPREVKYSFWPEGVLTYWKEDEGETVGGDELANDDDFDPRQPIEWLLKS